MINDFIGCEYTMETKIFRFINDVIAKNCEHQSFFSRIFTAIRSKFVKKAAVLVTNSSKTVKQKE